MSGPRASIAARLTVGVGVVAVVVFAAAGTLLQRALETQLIDAERSKLDGKLGVVQHFVAEAAQSGDRAGLSHHLDDLRMGHEGLHVWLVDAAGQPVYGTLSLKRLDAERGLVGAQAVAVDLVEAPLALASPWPGGTLAVAVETRPRERLLREHLVTLLAVCSLGVAASVALSWVAIRRGLRPVARLSDEARAITPSSLGRRLTAPAEGTELGGLVQSFNGLLERVEQAHAQLQAFNANVAHELRTPLASLVTGTQVALSAPRTREELREALISNREELELLNALVNDMLFLSRADRGDRAEGLERVDLGREADKAIHYCEALLHESGVGARRSGAASALCNPPLVRRAIVNLLTNAIRHSASGQVVRIVIDDDGAQVCLAVENPGPAIDAQVRARMFDRFYRADAARSRHQPGHGLGLAIVAAIARMHGGTGFAERNGDVNRIGLVLPRHAGAADAGDAGDAGAATPVGAAGG